MSYYWTTLQDLAVVVLLMLIPLLAPSPDAAAAGGGEPGQPAGSPCRAACSTVVLWAAASGPLSRPLWQSACGEGCVGKHSFFTAKCLKPFLSPPHSLLLPIAQLLG